MMCNWHLHLYLYTLLEINVLVWLGIGKFPKLINTETYGFNRKVKYLPLYFETITKFHFEYQDVCYLV